MYVKLRKSFISQFLVRSLVIFSVYFVLWSFFWNLGQSGVIIGISSILFLPAGLRFAALIFLPYKYWSLIILAELLSNLLFTEFVFIDSFLDVIGLWLLPCSICGVVIYGFRRFTLDPNFSTPQSTVLLISCMFLVSFLIGASNNYQLHDAFVDSIFDIAVFKSLTAFVFGDVIGILVILPVVLWIKSRQENTLRTSKEPSYFNIFLVTVPILVLLYLSLVYLDSNYSKIVIMFVVVIFSYFYKIMGAIFSIYLNVICILLFAYSEPFVDSILVNQTFLVTLSCLSLFLASIATQNTELQDHLMSNNKLLVEQRQNLSDSLEDNRNLTQQVMHIQETERKRIARDLHDDIGQNLTAISLELKMLKKRVVFDDSQNSFVAIKTILKNINQTIHRLMNALHPRILDEFGLFEALSNGDIKDILDKSGIVFTLTTDGDVKNIPNQLALVIYRVIQETANNTVKYSYASHFSVSIILQGGDLYLTISDDGKGISENKSQGLGILGIKERIFAIKGSHRLTSNQSGTEHVIQIPLKG